MSTFVKRVSNQRNAHDKKINMLTTDKFQHVFDSINASSPIICFSKADNIYHIECEKLDIHLECYFSTTHITYYGIWSNKTPLTIDAIFVLPHHSSLNILECTINTHDAIRTTGILQHKHNGSGLQTRLQYKANPASDTKPSSIASTNTDKPPTIQLADSNTSHHSQSPHHLTHSWCAEQMGLFSHQIDGSFRVPIFNVLPNHRIYITVKCLQSCISDGVHGYRLSIPLQFYYSKYPRYNDSVHHADSTPAAPPPPPKMDSVYSTSSVVNTAATMTRESHSEVRILPPITDGHVFDELQANSLKWSEYVSLRCNIYYPQNCQPKIRCISHQIKVETSAEADCIHIECRDIKPTENNSIFDHNIYGRDFEMIWTYYTPKLSQRSRSPLPPAVLGTQHKSKSDDQEQQESFADLVRAVSHFTVTQSPQNGKEALQFEAHFILFKDDKEFEQKHDAEPHVHDEQQANGQEENRHSADSDYIYTHSPKASQNGFNGVTHQTQLSGNDENHKQSIAMDNESDESENMEKPPSALRSTGSTADSISGVLCITAPKNSDDSPINTLPRLIVYIVDAQLVKVSYWNSIMKAIFKSMQDLTDNDLFNVLIVDGDNLHMYDDDNVLSEANDLNKRKSREWIMVEVPMLLKDESPDPAQLECETNILSALNFAYKMVNAERKDEEENYDNSSYLPIITLLTSTSLKNVSESAVCSQMQSNQQEHATKPRIFSVGIGETVNRYFLYKLANITRGRAIYIENENVMEKQIKHFLSSMRFCILYDISIEIEHDQSAMSDDASKNVVQIYPTNICDLFYPTPLFIRLSMPKQYVQDDANMAIKIIGYNCDCERLEMMVNANKFMQNRSQFPLSLLFVNDELAHSIAQCWYFDTRGDKGSALKWLHIANRISDTYQIATPYQPLVCFDLDRNDEDNKSLIDVSHNADFHDFDSIIKAWIARKRMHSSCNAMLSALDLLNGCISINPHIFGLHGKTGVDYTPHLSKIYHEAELHKMYQKYYEKYDSSCCPDCCIL